MKKNEKDLVGADAAVVETARSAEAASPATARHTEGPWRVVLDYPGAYQSYRVEAQDGNICVPCYGRERRGIDLANAHLIAAAPELLEALKERTEYACRWSCGHDESMRPINHSPECLRARAAIAKAEGRH